MNKQISNMAYGESEMSTRQKRIVTPGEPQGVKQYHWNTGAKENHQFFLLWIVLVVKSVLSFALYQLNDRLSGNRFA